MSLTQSPMGELVHGRGVRIAGLMTDAEGKVRE